MCRSYWVVTDRWQRFSSLSLSEASVSELAGSCDEFLVHGVDVEVQKEGGLTNWVKRCVAFEHICMQEPICPS